MTEKAPQETVVIIDNIDVMRQACAKALASAGYRVESFDDGPEGLAAIARLNPAVIVVDLFMPQMDGIEVVSRANEMDPSAVIIVMTAYPTIENAVRAVKAGASEVLAKPFTPEELRFAVRQGLEHHRLLGQADGARHSAD